MMAALATDSESVSEVMREWARELFLLRWVRTVRPGSDGDFLYRGLGYKNLLDVVSRGLQNLPVGMRPWGDIRPSHRIAVFDVQEEPTPGSGARVGGTVEAVQIQAVVSQTDIIAFLLYQMQAGHLGPALPDHTVESLGWVRRDVVTVPKNMPAVAAFALMLNRGVSGAGVVDGDAFDADAPLLSSLSVSDIRALREAADFDALALPVADFLLRQYGEAMPDAADVTPGGAVAGTPAEAVATTVAQVAAMAVAGGGGGEVTAITYAATQAASQLPSAAVRPRVMDIAACLRVLTQAPYSYAAAGRGSRHAHADVRRGAPAASLARQLRAPGHAAAGVRHLRAARRAPRLHRRRPQAPPRRGHHVRHAHALRAS
jgi:hypothetical protein